MILLSLQKTRPQKWYHEKIEELHTTKKEWYFQWEVRIIQMNLAHEPFQ